MREITPLSLPLGAAKGRLDWPQPYLCGVISRVFALGGGLGGRDRAAEHVGDAGDARRANRVVEEIARWHTSAEPIQGDMMLSLRAGRLESKKPTRTRVWIL